MCSGPLCAAVMTLGDSLMSGAVRAAPAIGGAFVAGPVLGPPIGGFVADKATDGGGNKFLVAGTAVGVTAWALGIGRSGGGGNAGVM